MPLHVAVESRHAAFTEQLLAARCKVDLQTKGGRTALQLAQQEGHDGIAALIWSTKREREEEERRRKEENRQKE
jgi:ankyrin repeat protein